MKKVKLISHKDLDGVACYIVLSNYIGIDNVEVSFVDYNNIEEVVMESLKNHSAYSKILITDISVKEDETINSISKIHILDNQKIQILDHHKTALDLNKYPWAYVSVMLNDRLTCGAELVLNYCKEYYMGDSIKQAYSSSDTLSKMVTIEEFVELVRRYDTWDWYNVHNDNNAKELNDLFYILGVDEFKDIFANKAFGHERFELFSLSEKVLLEQRQKEIKEYIEKVDNRIFDANIHGHFAGIVFAENFISEVGNKLGELNPQYDFILVINMSSCKMSFRTIKDEIDVSEIAKLFGGGGHPKASGASLNKELIIDFINKSICTQFSK